MWPSLGIKPFSTKKQHGFVYMMILDNHLNNSLSFSSMLRNAHKKASKPSIMIKKLCDFVQDVLKMLNEMCGWAGDNFVHWMSQVPTRKRYQSVNVLTGIAIPLPDSSFVSFRFVYSLNSIEKTQCLQEAYTFKSKQLLYINQTKSEKYR